MKSNKTFKNFQDWNSIDVHRKLGVSRTTVNTMAFEQWMDVSAITIPDDTLKKIYNHQLRLLYASTEWNEAELQYKFIQPLTMTIDFHNEQYNYTDFLQRKISSDVKGYHVQDIVDYMVATGVYEPEKPYFFLHEYKRFKGTESDPLGQLLIAMLAAQVLNNDGEPIYGCYVYGAIWNFILLEGNQYCHSQVFDARDNQELQIIWKILYHTKIIIEERIRQQLASQQ